MAIVNVPAYLGDFQAGELIIGSWESRADAGGSATRTTDGTLSVYKDLGDTQTTTGVTDAEDDDSLTGFHRYSIDTSADFAFYSLGGTFTIVIVGAVVDGDTLNIPLATFTIEKTYQTGLLHRTTLDTVASNLSFTLLTGSNIGSTYRNHCFKIRKADDPVDSVDTGIVNTYTGASKTVVPVEDHGLFTFASGDWIEFWADVSLKPTIFNSRVTIAGGVTGRVSADVIRWNGTAVPAEDTAGYPKVTIKDGTGAGEIALTSGKVDGVALVDTLTTYTGNTPQTGDSFARIGANGASLTALATQASVNTIDGIVDDILVDTAEIGLAGAGLTEAGGDGDHLTAINLPNQTMDITGTITTVTNLTNAPTNGDLTATMKTSVTTAATAATPTAAAVTGAVGSVAGNVDGNVTGSIGSLAAQAKADVNAEVDSALDTAIPGTPTANSVNERIKTLDDADIPARLPAALTGGRMNSSVQHMGDEVVTASAFATGAIDADAVAADAGNEIADAVLKRGASNTEDTADEHSLTGVILGTMESSVSGLTWTIRKTNGDTFATKTVSTSTSAELITGVD